VGTSVLDVLISALEWILSTFDRVWIIIDGLDECVERKGLLNILSVLARQPMSLFITSRPEKDVEKAFQGMPSLEMDQKPIKSDIAAHVDWSLAQDEFADISDEMKREIRETLMGRSAGM
jgi:hypothetical protein